MAVTKVVGAWPLPDGVTLEEVDGILRIKDGGVTTDKIANGAVTNDKLAGKYVELVDVQSVDGVTQVTFSGLSLQYNIFYMLYVRIINDSTSTMNLSIYRGDDTTSTNYYSRRFTYNQSGTSYGGGNDAVIATVSSYTHLNGIIWLTVDKGNGLRAFLNGVRDDPDYSDGILGTVSGITGGAPVTSIIVNSSVANAIKGTFMLFKLRGE